jgi:hypothetical protein
MENSEKNYRGQSFTGQNLANKDFSGADLRGADFTGAMIASANFSNCRSGLKPFSAVLVFIVALALSLLSGYVAMLAGATFQNLIKSSDPNEVLAGYILAGLTLIFMLMTIWKGGKLTLLAMTLSMIVILLLGYLFLLTGLGTGLGALYCALGLILFTVMLTIGTIARATAGTLSSNIIFLIVAISGGFFGKSLGGGIGTVVLAIACAIISKRALSNKKKFPWLIKVAFTVGSHFGTSFKNADLTGANFSGSKISNTNFIGAKLSNVNWENSIMKFNLGNSHKFARTFPNQHGGPIT